jgi:hypothetical protein
MDLHFLRWPSFAGFKSSRDIIGAAFSRALLLALVSPHPRTRALPCHQGVTGQDAQEPLPSRKEFPSPLAEARGPPFADLRLAEWKSGRIVSMWDENIARFRFALVTGVSGLAVPATRLASAMPKRVWIGAAIVLAIIAAGYFNRVERPTFFGGGRSSTRFTTEPTEKSPVISPTSSGLACRLVRRRLWKEDQGWIVRTVQICK